MLAPKLYNEAKTLRARAEEELLQGTEQEKEKEESLSRKQLQELIHEQRVHQIELDMGGEGDMGFDLGESQS